MSEWVNSRERLPQQGGLYLVCVHVPDKDTDALGLHIEYGDRSYVDCLAFDAEQDIWQNKPWDSYNAHLDHVDTDNSYYISHWMELPDKPEGV